MSLKTLHAVLTEKLNQSLMAGEYNSELMQRVYLLEVAMMKGQVLENYVPYNLR